MDSILVVCINVLFEALQPPPSSALLTICVFSLKKEQRLGSFDVGFLTLPLAITEMPGANFWAVALFFTLEVLGYSSAFAMLDAIVTLVMDSGIRFSRPVVVTALVIVSFPCSPPYCTEFGYYLLDGIDRWINGVSLIFVVFAECVSATTVYRWKDVVASEGAPAWIVYNAGYFGGLVFGVAVAHAVSRVAGTSLGFGLYIAGSTISTLVGRTPESPAPRFWSRSVNVSRFWHVVFYSVRKLTAHLFTQIINIQIGQSTEARSECCR